MLRESPSRITAWQRGSVAVEFAVTVSVFLAVVFGIIQFSLYMYVLNAESEAVRLGTRLMVVCGRSKDSFVRDRMHDVTPAIPATVAAVGFTFDNICSNGYDCEPLRLAVNQNLSIPTLHSLLGSFVVPRIPVTAMTIESMGLVSGAEASINPACN